MDRYIQFEGEVNKFSELLKVEPAGREIVDCLIRIEGHVKGAIAEVGDLSMDSVDNKMVDEALHWLMSGVSSEFLEVNSSDTIYALLTRVSERINAVLRSGRESISMLEDLNVKHMEVMRVILPPDELNPPVMGDGEGMERPDLSVNKLSLFINFLREKGVYSNDIFVVVGSNEPNMMRESSYLQIEIPKLKKIVLLNVDYGEATFVVNMSEDYSAWDVLGAKKSELIDKFGAKRILFSENQINKWYADLSMALFDGQIIDNGCDITLYGKNRVGMGREYFTAENVRNDLEAFAMNLAGGVPSLRVGLVCSANCVNGEMNIKLKTYLRRSGVLLDLNCAQADSRLGEILDNLKKLAGIEMVEYPEMEKSYFTAKNVKADLEAFVRVLGRDVRDLNTGSDSVVCRAVCSNGEDVLWSTYIGRAGCLLGYELQAALHHKGEIVGHLKTLAGFEVSDNGRVSKNVIESVKGVVNAGGQMLQVSSGGVVCLQEGDVSKDYVVLFTYVKNLKSKGEVKSRRDMRTRELMEAGILPYRAENVYRGKRAIELLYDKKEVDEYFLRLDSRLLFGEDGLALVEINEVLTEFTWVKHAAERHGHITEGKLLAILQSLGVEELASSAILTSNGSKLSHIYRQVDVNKALSLYNNSVEVSQDGICVLEVEERRMEFVSLTRYFEFLKINQGAGFKRIRGAGVAPVDLEVRAICGNQEVELYLKESVDTVIRDLIKGFEVDANGIVEMDVEGQMIEFVILTKYAHFKGRDASALFRKCQKMGVSVYPASNVRSGNKIVKNLYKRSDVDALIGKD